MRSKLLRRARSTGDLLSQKSTTSARLRFRQVVELACNFARCPCKCMLCSENTALRLRKCLLKEVCRFLFPDAVLSKSSFLCCESYVLVLLLSNYPGHVFEMQRIAILDSKTVALPSACPHLALFHVSASSVSPESSNSVALCSRDVPSACWVSCFHFLRYFVFQAK